MSKKQRRLLIVLMILLGVGGATALVLTALQNNLSYFHTPTDLVEGKMTAAQLARSFRLGGMVVTGSLRKDSDGLTHVFRLTDLKNQVTVSYKGIPPDLFREGQGVIAEGKMQADGSFVASTLLAKHDEKYMPPELAKSLKEQAAPLPKP